MTITRSARFWIGCVVAGLMFALTGCGGSSPDEDFSSTNATATPTRSIYASGAPGAIASATPSASVNPASTSVNTMPTRVELFPEMGYISNVKRPAPGKSGPVTCGDPKDVVSFDLVIGGTRTYNGVTVEVEPYKGDDVADSDRTSVLVTITTTGESSPLYALIVNGDLVTPITDGLDEVRSVEIRLDNRSWDEIKKITACASGL